MPRSKKLAHYPSRYMDIIEACAVRAERVSVPAKETETPEGEIIPALKMAEKLQGHFYAFVGALQKEAQTLRAQNAPKASRIANDIVIMERAAQSAMVLCRVEQVGAEYFTVFMSREESWQAKALLGAVTTKGGTSVPQEDFSESAERLMRMQKEKK